MGGRKPTRKPLNLDFTGEKFPWFMFKLQASVCFLCKQTVLLNYFSFNHFELLYLCRVIQSQNIYRCSNLRIKICQRMVVYNGEDCGRSYFVCQQPPDSQAIYVGIGCFPPLARQCTLVYFWRASVLFPVYYSWQLLSSSPFVICLSWCFFTHSCCISFLQSF